MHPVIAAADFTRPTRRRFMAAAAAVPMSGLVCGFVWPTLARAQPAAAAGPAPLSYQPNAWVRIAPDNSVTILSHKVEMGQGAFTGVPLLIAEELEVDVRRVKVQAAPPGAVYADPYLGGFQMTGGSTTVRSGWDALRVVGASARMVLMQAAAAQWGANVAECSVADGLITHRASGRALTYGAVADAAARLPAPRDVALKPESAFSQVGKPVIRLDAAAKTDGSAQYGIDVRLPGMAVAALVLAPHAGATVAGIDNEAEALAVNGVHKVLRFDDFVAVLGRGFAPANKASRLLRVRWKPGPGATLSSASVERQLAAALDASMAQARNEGDVTAAATRRRVQAEYRVPFLAHAPMEPVNCTVAYKDGKAEVWVGTQVPQFAVLAVAQVGGVRPEDVTLNTPFLGGGFGRRLEVDFIVKAALIAKVAGQPVKTIYSRENDIRGDILRGAAASRLVATLGSDGLPLTWHHRIAGGSIYQRTLPAFVKDGIDESSVEGAHDLLYAFPNQRVEFGLLDLGVPVAFWRSVGFAHNTFIVESFIDECAAAAKADPLRYRQRLVARDERFARVLATLAEQSGWSRRLPRGHFRGVAAAKPFGTYVAAVVEVQMTAKDEIALKQVWVTVDAGKLAAPDVCKAQIESGVVWGLTAALFDRVTFKDGQVEQSNFTDYRMLQLPETPPIDVRFIASGAAPGGIGEPGVPCMAPALANALAAATGRRLRSLPVSSHGLRLA